MRDGNTKNELCPWCLKLLCLIWVHGHGQCAHCGINVRPCCEGDTFLTVPHPRSHTRSVLL